MKAKMNSVLVILKYLCRDYISAGVNIKYETQMHLYFNKGNVIKIL